MDWSIRRRLGRARDRDGTTGTGEEPDASDAGSRSLTADATAGPAASGAPEMGDEPDTREAPHTDDSIHAADGPGVDARRRGGGRGGRDLLRWAARGVVGGLIATVGMTVYRAPVSRTLPPSAEFWARYVAGGEPSDHPGPALGLHLLYGASAGAVFGALFEVLGGGSIRDLPREAAGIALGTVYGAVLSVFGTRVMLRRVLDMELDVVEAVVFHGGHLVYGLTLGTWIGTRELATDIDFEEADDRGAGSSGHRQ